MEQVISEPWVPWAMGVLLPVMLIFGVAGLKKLVRGPTGFIRTDFFQGIELCWAVLGVAVLYFYDALHAYSQGTMSGSRLAIALIGNTILMVVTVFVTIFVATQHQELEGSSNLRRQVTVLGVACNLAGILLFVAFVVIVKGV